MKSSLHLRCKCKRILGHVITAEGIKPDPKKVEAISKTPRPENVQLLRSFLGTCGFLMKFIPNCANLSEPLRKLTRKGQVWEWTNEAESSFQAMKEVLVGEPCLAYFKLGAPTVVISDSSPLGLGNKSVAYVSRSLTPTERRYSQIECEALGCVCYGFCSTCECAHPQQRSHSGSHYYSRPESLSDFCCGCGHF
uniref:Reverse transcriptase/retrotransposon-derived protein RNase H-like domain-containing protein n=1 Tax=Oryzias latipes TaxID=8090 RepID=A0A3P9HFE4_ORYLA